MGNLFVIQYVLGLTMKNWKQTPIWMISIVPLVLCLGCKSVSESDLTAFESSARQERHLVISANPASKTQKVFACVGDMPAPNQSMKGYLVSIGWGLPFDYEPTQEDFDEAVKDLSPDERTEAIKKIKKKMAAVASFKRNCPESFSARGDLATGEDEQYGVLANLEPRCRNLEGSELTPVGRFIVSDKVGAGVFDTSGETRCNSLCNTYYDKSKLPPNRMSGEWLLDRQGNPLCKMLEKNDTRKLSYKGMLTRCIGLKGIEPGINDNTYGRDIMIHGTLTRRYQFLGSSASGGCVRMKNDEVVRVFDFVRAGTPVYISNYEIGSASEACRLAGNPGRNEFIKGGQNGFQLDSEVCMAGPRNQIFNETADLHFHMGKNWEIRPGASVTQNEDDFSIRLASDGRTGEFVGEVDRAASKLSGEFVSGGLKLEGLEDGARFELSWSCDHWTGTIVSSSGETTPLRIKY